MKIGTNLEKRIKRHVVGPSHPCFAVALPGFEAVCEQEIGALGDSITIHGRTKGGVFFDARLVDVLRANLFLRTAVRILMRLAEAKVTNFNQLETLTDKIPWDLYLPPGTMPAVRVSARHSRLYHSEAVTLRIEGRIRAFWQDQGMATAGAVGQTLFVRLENDRLTLSLDCSGASLYQRGIKSHKASAPVRETLAAAILDIGGFSPDKPLVDPMCGAGTFALEAALKAKRIPPGRSRTFAFMQWPAYRSRQWEHLVTAADRGVRQIERPLILASDIDQKACDLLAGTIADNNLGDAIDVQCRDFFQTDERIRHLPEGLVVLNPPYGRRLEPVENIKAFYARIGAKLIEAFRNWRVVLIVPDQALIRVLPFKLNSKPFEHGGLQLLLSCGTVR